MRKRSTINLLRFSTLSAKIKTSKVLRRRSSEVRKSSAEEWQKKSLMKLVMLALKTLIFTLSKLMSLLKMNLTLRPRCRSLLKHISRKTKMKRS